MKPERCRGIAPASSVITLGQQCHVRLTCGSMWVLYIKEGYNQVTFEHENPRLICMANSGVFAIGPDTCLEVNLGWGLIFHIHKNRRIVWFRSGFPDLEPDQNQHHHQQKPEYKHNCGHRPLCYIQCLCKGYIRLFPVSPKGAIDLNFSHSANTILSWLGFGFPAQTALLIIRPNHNA